MLKIIIVGGGIAGLTSSILLRKQGFEVTIFEKKEYPFHRVCGEYISNETLPFLKSLDIIPFDYGASSISKLELSTVSGSVLKCKLPLGGFGLSRYVLDDLLYQKAVYYGVQFRFEKVNDINFRDEGFEVTASGMHHADIVISAHGKRSNLDQKLNRDFFYKRSPYMGIKYHIKTDLQKDVIHLDNFPGGYAGLCKIEGDRYNLCYLTKTSNLKSAGSIDEMERKVLFSNNRLKNIFNNSDFIAKVPEVINEVSFAEKTLVQDHILYCGDSAGMITPLCGNGIAMAMHSAKILSEQIVNHSSPAKVNRLELENNYLISWKQEFSSRLRNGRLIQTSFGNKFVAEMAVKGLQRFPAISKKLIAGTHGNKII